MDVMGWVKSHPYTTGAIVIGGIILVFVVSTAGGGGNASASSGGPSDAVQAASINAEATVQAAQIAAGVQTAQTNAQATVATQEIAAQLAETQNTNQTQLQAIELQLAIPALSQAAATAANPQKKGPGALDAQAALDETIKSLFGSVNNNNVSPPPVAAIGTGSTNVKTGASGGARIF